MIDYRRLLKRFVQNRYLSFHLVYALDVMVATLSSLAAYMLATFLEKTIILGRESFYVFCFSFLAALFSSYVTHTYRHVIRHSTLRDLSRISLNVVLKSAWMSLFVFFLVKWKYLDDSRLWFFVLLDMMFTTISMVGIRVLMILLFEAFLSEGSKAKKHILIYGIDEKSVSQKLRLQQSEEYAVAGFCTCKNLYKAYKICGLPLYKIADEAGFKELVVRHHIQGILFPTQEDVRTEKERLIRFIENNRLKALIVPSIDEATGTPDARRVIRDIKVEDLLGRDEIRINMNEIQSKFFQKTVLVTGAAGSIGSELCRLIAELSVRKIILFDSAETPLHNLYLEMEEKFPRLDFSAVIGDVRLRTSVEAVFKRYNPHLVLHAAAYKHVPLMENNPCEAVHVNALGTRNVADMAVQYGVEQMVMISTDKAVNPTNVMGASKRLAEIYVQSLGCSIGEQAIAGRTRFITTRFGNVLGSNGSVIPLFKRQIEKGGPLTVTHPDIIRYFMTIPEACRLVLEAASIGHGNEIFVFDMGEAVKIDSLARRMVMLAGYRPDVDIRIVYTGLRPGEKLYEELLCNGEDTLPTNNEKIRIAKVRRYAYHEVLCAYEQLERAVCERNVAETVQRMKQLVPEYVSPANSAFAELDTFRSHSPVVPSAMQVLNAI